MDGGFPSGAVLLFTLVCKTSFLKGLIRASLLKYSMDTLKLLEDLRLLGFVLELDVILYFKTKEI